jgi:hypothetical protein
VSDLAKRCRVCGEFKALEEFHRDSKNSDGLDTRCVPCAAAQKRLTRYDLSAQEYTRMFFMQGSRCAICGRRQDELEHALCVDHDHASGKVRGLICRSCNLGIANFEENVVYLRRAIEYVEIWKGEL